MASVQPASARSVRSPVVRDLAIIVIVAVGCLFTAHTLEIAEAWNAFAEAHEAWELDEIPMALAVSSLAFAWFARRRWREARCQAARAEQANRDLNAEVALRRASEAELAVAIAKAKEAADAADEANQAKSRFLATISHEIRTPMNGVLGMAGLLLDSPLASDQRQQVQAIHSSGEALLDLINDILDLAKVEAGKIDLEEVDFSLPDLVDGAVELLAPRAHKKGIELAACIDAEVPILLRGDQGRVRQILLNLIGNAIKFTERGGVSLTVALESTDRDRSRVCFEITDTGIGIAEKARETLFRKFTQADDSTTRRFGGTGLGLAICRELANLMGGTIGFDSVEGEGSTFRVSIPLQNLNGTNRESLNDLAASLAGSRVLVVDDTAISRDVWVRSLSAIGLRADTCPNGPAALAAVLGDRFDIVIVDHMMPGMDGIALARAIRALAIPRQPLLVLSSSSGLVTSHNEAIRLGFDASIPKPLRRATMMTGLRLLVERSEAPTALAPAEPTPARPIAPPTRGRILLAEDNAVNRMFIDTVLARAGYRVDAAGSGDEAVNLFNKLPYDVVLMDVHMPEMDGLEATRRIRSRHPDRRTPIIALTANAMKGDRDICLAAGMDDYLSKPIDTTKLIAAIAHWLDAARSDARAASDRAPSAA